MTFLDSTGPRQAGPVSFGCHAGDGKPGAHDDGESGDGKAAWPGRTLRRPKDIGENRDGPAWRQARPGRGRDGGGIVAERGGGSPAVGAPGEMTIELRTVVLVEVEIDRSCGQLQEPFVDAHWPTAANSSRRTRTRDRPR